MPGADVICNLSSSETTFILLNMIRTRFMLDHFKSSPRACFLVYYFCRIFALVYLLGVMTVESQDRNHSIQYLKYASCGLDSSNIYKK